MAPATKARTVAPAHWIRRSRVAYLLDTTYPTVVALEARGLLHPLRSREGIVLHDPIEVDQLLKIGWKPQLGRPGQEWRPRHLGALQATVCDLIARGAEPRDVVRQLKISFDDAQAIYRAYHTSWDPLYETEQERAARAAHDARLAAVRLQEEGRTTREAIRLQSQLVRGTRAPRRPPRGDSR